MMLSRLVYFGEFMPRIKKLVIFGQRQSLWRGERYGLNNRLVVALRLIRLLRRNNSFRKALYAFN